MCNDLEMQSFRKRERRDERMEKKQRPLEMNAYEFDGDDERNSDDDWLAHEGQ